MQLLQIDDVDIINSIILNPFVNSDISDDPTFGRKIKTLPPHFEWLGVYENGQLHGVYALVPQNAVTAEIHTCLLPSIRGKQALQAGKLLLDHLFSKYSKAISYVPATNQKAKFYALMLGFQSEGVNKKSYLKNGMLIDQLLVGLTKGEWLCQ